MNRVRTGSRLLRAGQAVLESGDDSETLFVLESGWAFTFVITPEGRRQILELHLPGDMMGVESMGRAHVSHGVEAATDVSLCVMPYGRIKNIIRQDACMALGFASVIMHDRAMLAERLSSLGRRSAAGRVAHLMLELHTRLKQRNLVNGNECQMPLKQAHIADAVGLTVEHTNRALAEMRKEGLLTLKDGKLTLHNRAALVELAGWDDSYLDMANIP